MIQIEGIVIYTKKINKIERKMDLLEVEMRKERMRRAKKTRWPIFFNAIMALGLSFTVLCLVKLFMGMKQKESNESGLKGLLEKMGKIVTVH